MTITVLSEVLCGSEGLPTLLTDVGFGRKMNLLMSSKKMGEAEGFRTLLTGIGLLSLKYLN